MRPVAMITIEDPHGMRAWSRARRAAGQRVGFVPTMGYLHEGHLRLVDRARKRCDVVVVSIFVNPLQFGPQEDFARYPRDLARDGAATEARQVECLFVPHAAALYRREPAVRVDPGPLGRHLCGPWRPGHFEGVLTVVAKLFHLVEPAVAVFGRKDAQQATMIRRMVEDLDFPLEVLVAPTVREPDGLAMSSRNAYLEPAARAVAPVLSRALEVAHRAYRAGTTDVEAGLAPTRALLEAQPAVRLEYLEAVDPVQLAPVASLHDDTLVAVAARLGGTRLIDNIVLGVGVAGDETVSDGAGTR